MFGIDDALIGAIGGSLISGAFGMSGAASSAKGIEAMNAANAAEAQKNRDWQERMSNTAHTREVKDLRDAGLNPILSATGGNGASSPGGSMATMENTQSQSSLIKAQLANLAANTAKTIAEAQTEKNKRGLLDAQKDAAGGSLSTPLGNMPWTRVANMLRSGANSAKSFIKQFETKDDTDYNFKVKTQ
ncbi:MAG: DNA pilot protein [Arizlama microvirus]|nr:MAG: DNA pilot protein [Arizlama microvirus]